jgi:hypothetical protein
LHAANRARGDHQMFLIHHHRAEPPLEQMPRHPRPRIDEGRVAPVRLTHGALKAGLVGRDKDEMDMVRHQAISPARNAIDPAALCQQIAISA